MINNQTVLTKYDTGLSSQGYVAMGTSGYFPAEFNNFQLLKG